jgi:hypothetical protein
MFSARGCDALCDCGVAAEGAPARPLTGRTAGRAEIALGFFLVPVLSSIQNPSSAGWPSGLTHRTRPI